MQPEDAELVASSVQGNLEAFNKIVERYQTQVFNLAARILGNRASADDVAQETFISAHRAIGGFRGGSLRAWLLRIATNASLDFIRSTRRRPEDSLDESLLNPSFQPASREESPEQRAIVSLPSDQKTVLVLIDVQGLSYDEAAESTGTSLGTVKSRLSRARSRVRDVLMEHRELLPERFRQT